MNHSSSSFHENFFEERDHDRSFHEAQAVREELQQRLLSLSFHAFEHLIRELLTRLGYTEAEVMGRRALRQRTEHGGIDLQASTRTGVSCSKVIVQLKQYERPVSRRFIDELRGVMLRHGAGFGLVITTSTFSEVARLAARSDHVGPIRLVGREELLDLLFAHRLGVWQEHSKEGVEQWGIDEAFFRRLRQYTPLQKKFTTKASTSFR